MYILFSPNIAHLYDSFNDYWCSRALWFVSVIAITCINYSVNFILYCIGGKKFRIEFLTMIGCKKAVTSKPAVVQARSIEENPHAGTSQSHM